MKINDTIFNAELIDILNELQSQLKLNGISLLGNMKDGPDNVQVCCPYHKDGKERKPSGGIKKDTGIFHCFTCGTVKTFPEFVSECFGYNDLGVFGWKWLLKNFLSIQIDDRKDIELDLSRDESKSEQRFVDESELDSYRYYHPYMYKRKLTDEVIERFDIGYDKNTKCITFPVRDINGNTLFVARRSVDIKYFNYPSGASKPVYGLFELSQLPEYPKEIIICESMLDALTCWVYGKYAVALNGLGNELQFKQLNDMRCREFVLATDNDDAGMAARRRLRTNIRGKIITEYILPQGKKDINELSESEFLSMQKVFTI